MLGHSLRGPSPGPEPKSPKLPRVAVGIDLPLCLEVAVLQECEPAALGRTRIGGCRTCPPVRSHTCQASAGTAGKDPPPQHQHQPRRRSHGSRTLAKDHLVGNGLRVRRSGSSFIYRPAVAFGNGPAEPWLEPANPAALCLLKVWTNWTRVHRHWGLRWLELASPRTSESQ